MANGVLLTVSGRIPEDLAEQTAAGRRPRADYVVLAERLGADLIDYSGASSGAGFFGKVLHRVGGDNVLLAWTCYRMRNRYEAILTDGEQVGIPYAALCWFSRRARSPQHSMIVHIISVRKKAMLFKALGLRRRVDRMFVYSSWQRDFAVERLGMSRDDVHLTSFMVDTQFFDPTAVTPAKRRMICTAGIEFRDYATLATAVRGLDVEVEIAAASPWSKRTIDLGTDLPPNVTVCKLDQFDLRQLYADALFVVMPLVENEFQAGITAILEGMAMARAVVCSRTAGQTDAVIDGENGTYVPPGDVAALRAAIGNLLDNPSEVQRLGDAARAWVVANADIEVYADRIAAAVLGRNDS